MEALFEIAGGMMKVFGWAMGLFLGLAALAAIFNILVFGFIWHLLGF